MDARDKPGHDETESIPTMNDLMAGKRGLIMGVANDKSIAWGIAKTLRAAGRRAGLHLSGRGAGKAGPAAGGNRSTSDLVLPCDVTTSRASMPCSQSLHDKMGEARFSGACHCVLRQERAEGPLCRYHAARISCSP